jgi:hypothetical protein
LDRHCSLTDRTQRSAKAFEFGLRGGSRRHFTPCRQGLPELSAELGVAILQNVATAVQRHYPYPSTSAHSGGLRNPL